MKIILLFTLNIHKDGFGRDGSGNAGADGQPLGTVLRLGAVYGSRIKGNYERLTRALAGNLGNLEIWGHDTNF